MSRPIDPLELSELETESVGPSPSATRTGDTGCSGGSSSPFRNCGPFHHNVLECREEAETPREARSAGLDADGTYR